MSAATARPWTLREGHPAEIGSADPDHAPMFGNIAVSLHPYSERLANAALIVKAVNARDSLVEACELALEHEECVCEDKGGCLCCVLTAALEEAKS